MDGAGAAGAEGWKLERAMLLKRLAALEQEVKVSSGGGSEQRFQDVARM